MHMQYTATVEELTTNAASNLMDGAKCRTNPIMVCVKLRTYQARYHSSGTRPSNAVHRRLTRYQHNSFDLQPVEEAVPGTIGDVPKKTGRPCDRMMMQPIGPLGKHHHNPLHEFSNLHDSTTPVRKTSELGELAILTHVVDRVVA